jgi:8-hydroxy-5-deazaflavin:NADPH oxidoreductase
MNIGIIGTGSMGSALGKLWAQQGHQVLFSFSRDSKKLEATAQNAGVNAKVATPQEAVQESDVVVLGVKPEALGEALALAGSLKGKTVITFISDLQMDPSGQTLGIATKRKLSVAEQIAELEPDANVVEAFNVTFAGILASESRLFGDDKASIFYCGDNAFAKATVASLIEDCGYEAVDAGSLQTARSLETLATAWVQFAVVSGLFPNVGLKALRR